MKRLLPALPVPHFTRVLRAYLKGPANVFAVVVITAVLFMAIFADILASEMPIACRVSGELFILPSIFDDARLIDHDNQRLTAEVRQRGGWIILPPVPYGPNQIKVDGRISWRAPPGTNHLLGTDDNGRDVLSRIIHGSRSAVFVGVGSMILCTLLGVILGAIAAYFGGLLDRISRLSIETFTAFPTFFVILAIQGLFGASSLMQLVLIIAATRWTDVARVTRTEVLRTSNEVYVDAARALGLSHLRILRKHIMPAVRGPVIVASTYGVAGAILIESTLSFIGYGVPAPTASWGSLLRDAFATDSGLILMLAPGIILSCTVLAVNLLGEGLNEAVDRI